MKSIFKLLPFVLVAFAINLCIASCSSENNEPENPDVGGTGLGIESMIPYAAIKGTWIIESITDSETGKETSINQTIKIGDFTPKQESSNVVTQNGYQFWAESYFDLMSCLGLNGEEENEYVIIGFCKEANKGLQSSLIYELLFSTSTFYEDTNITHSYSLLDFNLSGTTLKAKNSVYSYIQDSNMIKISGTIVLKKL